MLVLLPCPFCGGDAFIRHVGVVYIGDSEAGPGTLFRAECVVCHVFCKAAETQDEAYRRWNRRPGPLTLRAQAEEQS